MDNVIVKNPVEKTEAGVAEMAPSEADKVVAEAEKIIAEGSKTDKVAEQAQVLESIKDMKKNDENKKENREAGRQRLKEYMVQAVTVLIDDVKVKYDNEKGWLSRVFNVKEDMDKCLYSLEAKRTKPSEAVDFDNLISIARFAGKEAKAQVQEIAQQYKAEDLDNLLTDEEKKIINLASKHLGTAGSPEAA